MGKRVLIVGCGYVGIPLGAELHQQGHEVFGLRRSDAADAELRAVGITPLHADITQPKTLTRLPSEYDWVVNCAATSGGAAEDYHQLYAIGNFNVINWLRRRPQRYLFTSSTSVYGQNDGSLVTETDNTNPDADTAKALLQAEQILASDYEDFQSPFVILRVAGIYGPSRGHWLKQFLRGEARLDGGGSRFLNMIHRDDLVRIAIAALNGPPQSVYNAVDNEPVSQRDFFAWLAEKLNQPMPPSAATDAESNRKRGVTNKRVSNERLRQQLGYQFKYPTFREGYIAELERLKNP